MRSVPEPHPGIRIDKIPIKGRAGLLFTVGVMVLFLIALPEVRWFFLFTLPAGLVAGAIMYFLHRR